VPTARATAALESKRLAVGLEAKVLTADVGDLVH
jgi:hypothetical protein